MIGRADGTGPCDEKRSESVGRFRLSVVVVDGQCDGGCLAHRLPDTAQVVEERDILTVHLC